MRARTLVVFVTAATLAVFAGQVPLPAVQNGPGGQGGGQGQKGKPGGEGIATLVALPSLGNAQAVAVNSMGTVIVGQSFDSREILHPVKWTLQNGAWTMTALPFPPDATSAETSGVNDFGDIAGYDHPSNLARALFWAPSGGFTVLGCGEAGPNRPSAISASGQIVVGTAPGHAALWRPGSCREALPPLVAELGAVARAVGGDGTIVGGHAYVTPNSSSAVPVRWTHNAGQWNIEPLDSRPGFVRGGNAAGDFAGYVELPCGSGNDCNRAVIWYASGDSRQLGTLGGDHSVAHDVNAGGEVVGMSTSPRVGSTAFYWSESTGMVQLPFKGSRGAIAFAVSDVRPDGTRLAVGAAGGPGERAAAWVIRNP